jgi:hypothetical protein
MKRKCTWMTYHRCEYLITCANIKYHFLDLTVTHHAFIFIKHDTWVCFTKTRFWPQIVWLKVRILPIFFYFKDDAKLRHVYRKQCFSWNKLFSRHLWAGCEFMTWIFINCQTLRSVDIGLQRPLLKTLTHRLIKY